MKFIFTYIFILISFVSFSQTPQIGDFLEGGVVFWLNPNNSAEGLVCDIEDIAQGVQWGLSNVFDETSLSLGSGELNTTLMVNSPQSFPAAEYCVSSTNSGYNDWFLPSQEELMQICLNQNIINETSLNNGGSSLLPSWYWSSSNSGTLAWHVYFPNCGTNDTYHSQNFNVRAVRSFSLLAGCTDSLAFNFDPNANIDDGSCFDAIYGCTDSDAFNFDENANTDDGSCCFLSNVFFDNYGYWFGNYNDSGNADYILGDNGGENFGYSIDLSDDGLTMIVGAPFKTNSSINPGLNAGSVRVFQLNIQNEWVQIGQEIYGQYNSLVGKSVSINAFGNRIAFSHKYNNQESISIYILMGNSWILDETEEDVNCQSLDFCDFGSDLSFNSLGDKIIVGNPQKDVDFDTGGLTAWESGGFQIYSKLDDSNNWHPTTLIDGDPIPYCRFGEVVDINADGNIVAASSYYRSFVKVFEFNNNEYQQIGNTIYGSDCDGFGRSIDLSDDGYTIVIGASEGPEVCGTDSAGYVEVYEFVNGSWIRKGDKILGEEVNDEFGFSTSISSDGNIIVVGAPSDNFNTGKTSLFRFDNDNWISIGNSISGLNQGDKSGYDVCINSLGNKFLTSSILNDEEAENSGQVRQFEILSNCINFNGCSDSNAVNFDLNSIGGTDVCIYSGCTDEFALNFNIEATIDDDSCIDAIYGCTDSLALNFDQQANTDDGSCCFLIDQIGELNEQSHSLSFNYFGNLLAIGNPSNVNSNLNGNVVVYENVNNTWIQHGQTLFGQNSGDFFGGDLALNGNGNRLIIGAEDHDGYGLGLRTGSVWIYEFVENSWQQLGNEIIGLNWNDSFGKTVCINHNGDIIAAGAIGGDDNGNASGEVRIFSYSNSQWQQLGNTIAGENPSDLSGNDLELDSLGNTIIIGSQNYPGTFNYEGQVRVFDLINNEWIQRGESIIGDFSYASAGHKVSISNDGNTISFSMTENYGTVRVLDWNSNQWVQRGSDIIGENENDYSGRSLSLSGDGNTILIGAPDNDANGDYSGHARMFKWQNNNWIQVANDFDGDSPEDHFGFTSDISKNGEIIAIGANLGNYTKIFNVSNNTDCTGCTDSLACNFNPNVLQDDGSCLYADELLDCEGNCLFNTVILTINENYGDGSSAIFSINGEQLINGIASLNTYAPSTITAEACVDLSRCAFFTFDGNGDYHTVDISWTITDTLGSVLASGSNYVNAFDSETISFGEEDCIGCMDSTSCNYDPDVIFDDGSCTYVPIGIDCDGSCITGGTLVEYSSSSVYFHENSFTITNCNGDTLASMASGVDGFYSCIELPDIYFVSLTDSYGDGWNGGFLSIGGVEYTQVGSYDFPYSEQTETFAPYGDCQNCYAEAIINEGLDTIVSCDSVLLFANDIVNGSYHWSTSNEPIELSIGDTYQGGVIFYLDGNGGGLVAATEDQSNAQWGCSGTYIGTQSIIGSGNQNSLEIISNCENSSIAAQYCNNLIFGGYNDWYLPSKDELNQMFINKDLIGGFQPAWYWSSTESGSNNAFKQRFSSGSQTSDSKGAIFNVRAVRSFSSPETGSEFENNILVTSSGWNSLAITDSLGCISIDSIYVEIETCGCTDETATNYNELATIDDGSCIDAIYGCTDSLALNFDSFANTNDESCLYGIDGCMDWTACNFNPDATITLFDECIYPEYGYDCSGLCLFDEIPIVYYQQSYDFNVFVDVSYSNQFDQINSSNLELHLNNPFVDTAFTIDSEESYSPDGDWFQFDDQFCGIYQPYVIWLNSPSGCSDTLELITYSNQELDFGNDINSNNICDGLEISGCTDSTALNYDFQATLDDGSCVEIIQGCTDSTANNYLSDANVDDGSCSYCTIDAEIISQNPTNQTFCNGYYAITPYGQSPYNYYIDGQAGQQYNASVCNGIYEVLVTDANNCQFEQTLVLSNYVGCMDIDALNYDETALFDDGSCIDVVLGCMDELADNYNENANVDDDNCIFYGCTDISADNFDESANVDNESCIYCDIYITGLVNNPNTSTDCNGLIILSINSSHEPVDITWNNGSVGGFINNICAGEYVYVATDAQGCELTDTIVIDGSATGCTDPLACNYQEGANIDDGSCLFLDPIDLELNSTSDAELVLSWSNYPNSDMYYIYKGYNSSSLSFLDSTDSNSYLDEFINLQNTYYKVYTNTSCNGQDYLISSDAIQYTYTEELSIEITVNEPSCLCCNDGSVSYIVSGGTPPYSLSNWNQLDSISSGQTIQVYVSDAAGSFPIYEEFIFGFENETYGCTDPIAQNYDECASLDDASCEYDQVSACDVLPQGLFVDNIIHNRVRFNWSEPIAFPSYYMIRYRPVGTTSWTVMTAGPTNSNEFTGTSRTRYFMESETTYQWNIRARDVDDNGSTICQSPWSETKEFTTLPDCPNLVNLSTNTEANWVDFMAESVDSEIEIYDSKGKLRIVDENNYRYINGSSEGIDFRKGNFIPSTAYEWHTKAWCVGNVDADGNPDPQYHSGWGEFSEFTTEDPCDKIPTNLITTTNGSQNLITMNWDTPLSGEPDHYFLELNNETTGQVFQWNNISGSATSKTKYNQIPGHSFNWRIRGACGTTGTSWATIFTQPVYYTLGASRLSNIDKLNVYPNPSRDVFNVSFEVKQAEDLRLEVINVLGEIIIEENIESFKGSYLNSLDMSSQSNGIYLLKIYTNNGISTTKLTLQ